MPPRTTRKSYRPRVSDRTMVGTLRPHCLFASETEGRRHANEMNLRNRENHGSSLQHMGWMAGRISPLPPVEGEAFFLTSPFIERACRKTGFRYPHVERNWVYHFSPRYSLPTVKNAGKSAFLGSVFVVRRQIAIHVFAQQMVRGRKAQLRGVATANADLFGLPQPVFQVHPL